MNAPASQLMPVAEALQRLLAQITPRQDAVEVPLPDALGAVLTENQRALSDVPAHDNSAMDGFALNTADLQTAGARLTIAQTIAAGHPGRALLPGTAARIFTGAAIPAGANAVVMQENCRFDQQQVSILKKPEPGENIRRRGHDIARDADLLPAGHILRPQDLGLLASLGISRIRVSRPLTVAIINTGDEVVAPGQALQAGQIHDSNSFTLAGLLQRMGCTVLKLGIVADDLRSTEQALAEAARQADCIITTGGVSVGDEDHVRQAVANLGELNLWKLAIKPGKPFSFGRVGQTPCFGLPGNPVAVFVTFLLLVKPCLLKLLGADPGQEKTVWVKAGFSIGKAGSRQEYLRVRLKTAANDQQELVAFTDQGSSIMTSVSWADGLAVVPAGAVVQTGDLLRFMAFDGLL
ncbi:MAG: molybdopterin molybdotransferase MoeA [Pseudomonadales bacterium]|nr:molybdopterin molybdotransferase MoeA [Pseudomonadales bacterium]